MNKRRSCSCFFTLVFLVLVAIAGVLFYIAYPIVFAPPPKPEETAWPENLKLISRSEWSEASINPSEVTPMGEINRITLHHDGIPSLIMATETQVKKRVFAIRDGHINTEKYADIGYHYIIDPFGRIWEGRSIEYQGAHAKGHNKANIGILFLGNTLEERPTEKGLNSLYTFLIYLQQRYEIEEKHIYTHKELGQTDCPGKYLQQEIDLARKEGKFYAPPIEHTIDWNEIYEAGKDFLTQIKDKVS